MSIPMNDLAKPMALDSTMSFIGLQRATSYLLATCMSCFSTSYTLHIELERKGTRNVLVYQYKHQA